MSDNKHTTPTSGGDQYGRCLLLSLLAVMTVLTPAELKAQSMAGQTNGLPKLVVNILVDQLRDDYLEAFMPLYGNDGFKRLFKEGRVYTQANYPMAHPDGASRWPREVRLLPTVSSVGNGSTGKRCNPFSALTMRTSPERVTQTTRLRRSSWA